MRAFLAIELPADVRGLYERVELSQVALFEEASQALVVGAFRSVEAPGEVAKWLVLKRGDGGGIVFPMVVHERAAVQFPRGHADAHATELARVAHVGFDGGLDLIERVERSPEFIA